MSRQLLDQTFVEFLTRQTELGCLRHLPYDPTAQTMLDASLPNRAVCDFSSNDYLGLSTHPDVIKAAQLAAKDYGVGSTGSRLLSGDHALFHEFEAQIAHDKGTEAALIFGSGFQANSSVLAALLDEKIQGKPPLVFTDKLIHASLHQACQLAGIKQIRFKHNSMQHLHARLMQYRDESRAMWIITESVFGMDGDCLPIDDMLMLADQFDAHVFIDEAHATGMFGVTGHGLCQHKMQISAGGDAMTSLQHSRGVVMGTFSKALGGSGAYVACSRLMRDYLLNRCAGFIYSTAPSPVVIAAMYQAWQLLPHLQDIRERVLASAAWLRTTLQQLNFNTGVSTTHIVPVILGCEHAVVSAKRYLAEQGLMVSAIRTPTVPASEARLRIALTATHLESDCQRLVDCLVAWRAWYEKENETEKN